MKKKQKLERLPDLWYVHMVETIDPLGQEEAVPYPWLGQVVENLATNIDNAMEVK
jgi:hypothetical protein